MLPDVRTRTQAAIGEVERLERARESARDDEEEYARVEHELRKAVSRWLREMEALGLEVKGPWRVDFDNGSGYYCWRWPEVDLDWYHGYEEDFEGRIRIQ